MAGVTHISRLVISILTNALPLLLENKTELSQLSQCQSILPPVLLGSFILGLKLCDAMFMVPGFHPEVDNDFPLEIGRANVL